MGFSASNLQGADHFEKPALQFGNAVSDDYGIQRANERKRLEEVAKQAEFDALYKQAEPFLLSDALEPLGNIPALSVEDLLKRLKERGSQPLMKVPDEVIKGLEPVGFYFTSEWLKDWGFEQTDRTKVMSVLSGQACSLGLVRPVEGFTKYQTSYKDSWGDWVSSPSDRVIRGYQLTDLGQKCLERFAIEHSG